MFAAPFPLLPIRLSAQTDELFSSWLARLSAAYSLKTRSFCGLLTGKSMEFAGDLDGIAGEPLRCLLAARTGYDTAQMAAKHSLTGFAGTLFPRLAPSKGTPWVLPLGPFHHLRPALQYCPLCLAQPPVYYRRAWRLSLFGVCPQHGVKLRHVCPGCASPVHPFKSEVRWGIGRLGLCPRCGLDLSRIVAEPADGADLNLARELRFALDQNTPLVNAPGRVDLRAYFEGLGLLCARLLRRQPRLARWRQLAAEAAGITSLPGPVRRHVGNGFDSLPDPTDRQAVLRTAHWLLGAWPDRFLEVAHAAQTRTSDFVSHFVAAPPVVP